MIVIIALFKSFLVELVCFRFYLKSFFLDGHGTKYKKCMGTQNPRFYSLDGHSTQYQILLGTWILPLRQNSVQVRGTRVTGCFV